MTLTVPTDAAGIEEILNSPARLAELFDGGRPRAEFGELIRNYSAELAKRDTGVTEQTRAQVAEVTRDWLTNNAQTGGVPAQRLPSETNVQHASARTIHTASRYAAAYNAKAPGAGLDHQFYGANGDELGKYLKSIYHQNVADGTFAAERTKLREVANAFGSTVPSDGGFLIPERLRADLLRVSLESAIVRPRARVVPMDSLTLPFPMIDSTSNASNVYGGVTGYWTEEGAQFVASNVRFGRVTLTARKLTAYTEVPNELFTDSIISLEALINEVFPEAIAWFEDIAFMNGNGVGQPKGWLRAEAAISVTAEFGQAAGSLLWENIVKMYARMLPSSLNRAVWIANINTFPELATMALSVGTGGAPVWINNGVSGPPVTILGRPVIFTEKVPALGSAGDINFVDLGYYLIGDRQSMQAMTSSHFKFNTDVTAMRFLERVDGQPWLQSAITPNQGTDTLSPFVKLAAR